MAASLSSASIFHSLSSRSLSSSEPPPPPPAAVYYSTASTSGPLSIKTLNISQPPVIHEPYSDLQSVLFPSLAFSNTFFFKTPYNVQVIVSPDESEESLIGRFRREVFRANLIQECKRRRFFETNQEKRKRKVRDAARRRARRRPRPVARKDLETPRKKAADDQPDNWDMLDTEIPYSNP